MTSSTVHNGVDLTTTPPQSTPPPTASEPVKTKNRGDLFRTVIGIAIEYYDFTAFAIFAPFFATQFFSPGDPVAATLSALVVFAVGFLFRPLGALFFGWLADRRGRKNAMVAALVVTASGSLLIGISPTSATLGFGAAILLSVARILQGFGHGGESAGAYSYLSEMAPRERRGLWSALIPGSLMLGVFIATLMGGLLATLISPDELREWGWRIPFIIGGLTGFFGIYLRRSMKESTAFEDHARRAGQEPVEGSVVVKQPLFRDMWEHRASVLRVLGLTSGVTVAFYTWGVNASSHAITSYGANETTALWSVLAAQCLYLVALPLWGLWSDKVGRRPNFILYGVLTALIAFPVMMLMGSSWWQIFLATGTSLIIIACAMSIDPAYFAELFPTSVRGRGLAFPYAVGIALFGGTAPMLDTWANSVGKGWLFTLYTIAMGMLALFTAWKSPETAGRDLHDD